MNNQSFRSYKKISRLLANEVVKYTDIDNIGLFVHNAEAYIAEYGILFIPRRSIESIVDSILYIRQGDTKISKEYFWYLCELYLFSSLNNWTIV